MRSYRSILALILAWVTTFLVSCGGPSAMTPPPTYTAEQIQQIQRTAPKIVQLRNQMPELEATIQNRDWVDVSSYIHGQLGDLRQTMSYLTRQLLPQEQKTASTVAKDLFEHLQTIDTASQTDNYEQAINNYREAVQDFDRFLELIPQTGDLTEIS